MTRLDRLKAMAAGRAAGRAGQPVTACPYRPGRTPLENALTLIWVREWTRATAGAAQAVSFED
ncbi:hypothetical protein GCM10018962_77200 [Dactylosporangium matsuzakiense]|uniref:Rmf/CrpP fold protein n=1 Tax=Dactylosporangium matsuzakiense TaxID=53360 RepID=UPI0031EC0D52